MTKITDVVAREILDSRGNPTLEVEVEVSGEGAEANMKWVGRAGVPSGASTGAHEALELRDKDPKRYHGKGVLQALRHVREACAPAVRGMDATDWRKVDETLLKLDGTENKAKLGANAILGVSLAAVKAAALAHHQALFEFLAPGDSPVHARADFSDAGTALKLPVPLMNVINGGAHANNGLDVQEFMIVPTGFTSFREALRAGSEIFQTLKKILDKEGHSVAVGDEGGFAPRLKGNRQALELLMKAIEQSGYKPGDNIFLGLDVAATELVDGAKYRWEGGHKTAAELSDVYAQWSKQFPLITVEDGLGEDDWDGWVHLTNQLGKSVQLVGDDLFVTNTKRLKRGLELKAANAILIKVNQIGSLSETLATIQLAQNHNFRTVMSHRSGETEDATIADLSVAFSCQQIKTGSLCRSERTAKYNQLLRIEEKLGAKASYWGKGAFA